MFDRNNAYVIWSSKNVVSSSPFLRVKSFKNLRNEWRPRRQSWKKSVPWEGKWTIARSWTATCVCGFFKSASIIQGCPSFPWPGDRASCTGWRTAPCADCSSTSQGPPQVSPTGAWCKASPSTAPPHTHTDGPSPSAPLAWTATPHYTCGQVAPSPCTCATAHMAGRVHWGLPTPTTPQHGLLHAASPLGAGAGSQSQRESPQVLTAAIGCRTVGGTVARWEPGR